jgi:excinuclease ABC subunit A
MDKPDVDMIEGLSPAISIEQKATSHNPRSTVGTVTEIHDYLRLLFARAGTPYCPIHDIPLQAQTVSQMVDTVLALPEDTKLMILAPVARERKGEFVDVFAEMQAQGYVRFRVDGDGLRIRQPAQAEEDREARHRRGDRPLKVRADMQQRLAESFEAALRLAEGRAIGTGDGQRQGAPVQRQVLLPDLPLLHQRAGAAAVLVQLAGGRLPHLRRPGHMEFFDPARVVAFPSLSLASGAIKGWDRRNPLLLQPDREPGQALQVRRRHALRGPARNVQQGAAARLGRRGDPFSYVMESGNFAGKKVSKKHPFEGIIPNMERRYRETDSPPCARNWRATAACSPAPTAKARACAPRRATCAWAKASSRAIYEIST